MVITHANELLPASAFYRALDELAKCGCRAKEDRARPLLARVSICGRCRVANNRAGEEKPCRWTASADRLVAMGWTAMGDMDRDVDLTHEFGLPILHLTVNGALRPEWPQRISGLLDVRGGIKQQGARHDIGRAWYIPGAAANVDRVVRACMLDLEMRRAVFSAIEQGADLTDLDRLVGAPL